ALRPSATCARGPALSATKEECRQDHVAPAAVWAPSLKTVLVQRAWTATRSKNNYLHAQFLRLRARRGPKRPSLRWPPRSLQPPITCCTIRRRIAISGSSILARLEQDRTAQRLARRIQALGYEVQIRKAA